MGFVLLEGLLLTALAAGAPAAAGGGSDAIEVDEAMQPATRAAKKVLAIVGKIDDTLTQTKYQHRTVVRRREGVYLWDCSGMADWILRRAAPKARASIERDRPVAATFFRKIDKAPVGRSRDGWQKLRHIEDARPGDLFAWLRPKNWKSKNTGHVGFLLEPPAPVPGFEGAYTLRIVDATSLPHQDDTRTWEDGGGFGYGTILVLTDGQGQGTAYGWFGTDSRGVLETRIVFGRVTR